MSDDLPALCNRTCPPGNPVPRRSTVWRSHTRRGPDPRKGEAGGSLPRKQRLTLGQQAVGSEKHQDAKTIKRVLARTENLLQRAPAAEPSTQPSPASTRHDADGRVCRGGWVAREAALLAARIIEHVAELQPQISEVCRIGESYLCLHYARADKFLDFVIETLHPVGVAVAHGVEQRLSVTLSPLDIFTRPHGGF